MPEPIPFAELMSHVARSRSFLDEAAELMVGEERSQFNNLLSMIDTNIEQAKTAVPDALNMFQAKYDELSAMHEENLKNIDEIDVKLAELDKQFADGTLPKPEAPPETPVDPALGRQLREEILAKFVPQTSSGQSTSGVAWQDWSLDGNWLPDDNDQQ